MTSLHILPQYIKRKDNGDTYIIEHEGKVRVGICDGCYKDERTCALYSGTLTHDIEFFGPEIYHYGMSEWLCVDCLIKQPVDIAQIDLSPLEPLEKQLFEWAYYDTNYLYKHINVAFNGKMYEIDSISGYVYRTDEMCYICNGDCDEFCIVNYNDLICKDCYQVIFNTSESNSQT
jgi:hypothetical protein